MTEEQPQVVTKTPNPGRQAAGKRLAEWNRKNKEDLLKNKQQVPAQVTLSEDKTSTSPSSHWQYSGIAVILVLGVAGGLYFYAFGAPFGYTRKTPAVAAPEPVKKPIKKYME